MKYIDRSRVVVPANLQGQAAPTSGGAVQKSIYAHADVKNALNNLQHGICCYCETHYQASCPGDVEHFRPKNGWQQDRNDKELHQPGYYWLAYKWENLLYACEWCNRIYKHNYFPLKDPSKRFDPNVKDISEEEPLLINPYEEQHPENHLKFEGLNIIGLTPEGNASIEYYGLDRKELDEPRRGIYNEINAFVDLAELSRGTPNEALAQNKVKNFVNQKIYEGQHTLLIKCDFGAYL